MKEYPILEDIELNSMVNEGTLPLIYTTRQGISFELFDKILSYLPIKFNEWSNFLHLSQRTMQRYKKEKKHFDAIYAERILEIMLVYKSGEEVFGNKASFDQWMNIKNISLGGVKPRTLLDSTFGIAMIKDELIRIEQGVIS